MKINKIIAALTASVVLFAACNDEEFIKETSYQNDSEGFFQSEMSMEIGLAACYAEVQYMIYGCMRTTHSWMLMGCNLDSFTETSATGNVNWGSMGPNSGYARHWADYMYVLANRANTVVDMIDDHEDIAYTTPTKKNELRAEAVFMRAWAYRVLAGMYGGVVYSEHSSTEARYDYELNTRQETWEKIKEDFAWAEQNLPSTPRLMGTVTKAAAGHYLAEVCLALGDFAGARDAANRVIGGQDGDYHLMTTRFGNRANQAVDRYGNSLAAPQGAYWDLFRSSAKTDGSIASDGNSNDPANKEAIWVCQSDFAESDLWTEGGSGDSWWRTHNAPVEACWAPWLPMGGKNGTREDRTQKNPSDPTKNLKFYIFTADATCFPEGVSPAGAGTPAADIPEAQGRKLAYNLSVKNDSIANRAQGNGAAYGLTNIATEYVTRVAGDPLGSVWDDPNDFRGSEVMIQRDPYLPSGKKWSEVKKLIDERAAAHPDEPNYVLTAADTMNVTPRFWKFSDDKHPSKSTGVFYDCDWYMVRIAETYLLRAEAYLGLGDKASAAADINVLRERAGAKPATAGDIDIDYIMDERIRELFGEEQRWITLNRLTCNPNATYVLEKYPTQNTTSSNYMYERVHKYGFGFEGAPGAREAYTDIYGKTRHYSNFKPHNYVFPIPTQIIQSNKDVKIPQNDGY
ncbi:MAG: RagB/SusD family nutrient uptake outer membrane protein [Bacteroidales bacterium]|nr:RagB/SusD family nutrient uptake outer membrane protein [Bacteroidales bacterium]